MEVVYMCSCVCCVLIYISDCPQNVWVCYNFIGLVSRVSVI